MSESPLTLRKLSESGSDKIAKGAIKRRNMFGVPYDLIKIEKNFNVRDMSSADVKAHVQSIFETIMADGEIPPLLFRIGSKGDVTVTDGQCRYTAYGMAIKAGKDVGLIPGLEDLSDPAGRVKIMLTANQGLRAKPLEIGMGYKRLVDEFNETNETIAASMGCSVESVKQLLILANADARVHDFVKAERISAHEAINLIRVHGEGTADFIENQLEVAKAKGQTKVTKAGMNGRALPKKIVSNLVSTVHTFTQKLDKNVRKELASLEKATPEELKGKTVTVDAAALLELVRMQATIDENAEKQKAKEHAKEGSAKQTQMAV